MASQPRYVPARRSLRVVRIDQPLRRLAAADLPLPVARALAIDVADGDDSHPLVAEERIDVVEPLVAGADHAQGDLLAGRRPARKAQRRPGMSVGNAKAAAVARAPWLRKSRRVGASGGRFIALVPALSRGSGVSRYPAPGTRPLRAPDRSSLSPPERGGPAKAGAAESRAARKARKSSISPRRIRPHLGSAKVVGLDLVQHLELGDLLDERLAVALDVDLGGLLDSVEVFVVREESSPGCNPGPESR